MEGGGGAGGSLKCGYSEYDLFVINLGNTNYESHCTSVKIQFSLFKNLLTPVINNTSMEQSQQMGQMLALKYFEFKWNNSVAQFCKNKTQTPVYFA